MPQWHHTYQVQVTCKDHHGMLVICVTVSTLPSRKTHTGTSDIMVASYQVQNSSRYSFPVSSKVQDNIWDRKARYKVRSGLEWRASKCWLTWVRGYIYVFTHVCSPCSLLGRTTTDEVVWMSATQWHKTKVLQFYIQFTYIYTYVHLNGLQTLTSPAWTGRAWSCSVPQGWKYIWMQRSAAQPKT